MSRFDHRNEDDMADLMNDKNVRSTHKLIQRAVRIHAEENIRQYNQFKHRFE